MKKRIAALLIALLLVAFSLPIPVNAASVSIDEIKPNVVLSIVPCHAADTSVDLKGENLKDIQIYTSKGVDNQMWILGKVGDYYTITSKKTKDVIEVPDGKAVADQKLQVNTYDGSDKQLWRLEKMDDGSYSIHSKLDDSLVWDVQGESKANGARIMLHAQHNNSNQKFLFINDVGSSGSDSSDSYEADDFARYGIGEEYSIVPCVAGGSCVDLNGSNETDVMLYKSHRHANQRWKIKRVGNYYAFISVWKTDKAIDVPGGDASSEKQLGCYEYHGGDNQLWRLESLGDGTYLIHSKLNDKYVWDIRNGSWNNGNAIQLYDITKRYDQRFRFVHTSTIEPMSEWGSSRQDCSGSNWSVWDGSIDHSWYNSSVSDQYINSAAQLAGLMSYVINGYDMTGKTIHLMCDINLAGIHWTPIGFSGKWFRGHFNGHNHAIIGLNNTHEDDNCGLFGMIDGGSVCNLAVKGTIKGNYQVGGIVGILEKGHLCNIYSEVTINNCTHERQGGIVGAIAYGGLVDHCTQNASVNSTDWDKCRGGIAGYSDGLIRCCVNNASLNHAWDYGGGIAGITGGVVEFCANHGMISGGTHSKYIGGITGWMSGGAILGCYNDGEVLAHENDYIGGICGYESPDWCVICCVNNGKVHSRNYIGGICGEGRPIKCLNMGVVTGNNYVGAIAGNARSDIPYCYALAWSSPSLAGKEGSRSEWVTADDLLSGQVCFDMNKDGVTYDYHGITAPMSQNIGSDPYPTFGSSKVTESGGTYSNNGFRVTAEYQRGYGTVEGAGTYNAGDKVTLTATPANGCLFDHFEVKSVESGKMTGWNGEQTDSPATKVKTYKEDTITLTDSINKSYTVKAVFTVFDDTPDDMKVTVKVELECVDDAGGWNNDNIPVDLVDSAGEKHRWNVSRTSLDDEKEKVDHTFSLGTASPVAVYVYPNFGGGLTFRSYGLKARMWVNGSGTAMESDKVVIRSWPFVSSISGDDYMNISFENFGNSTVGGSTYTTCKEAWEKGKSDSSLTIRLESAWLLGSPLELSNGQSVKLDLNGYPIIRAIKKTQDDGELFKVGEGATLTITDSTPSRKSCGNFTGGSVQGGRSDNTAGLIECKGRLVMTGGTLYNGGTTDKGGAIKLSGSAEANLTGVLISDCWTDKAVFSNNNGGAIYMTDKAAATLKDCTIRFCRAYDYGGGVFLDKDDNRLNCENVNIIRCTADDNQGGAVYQDGGETNWIGGKIDSCRASEDNGGGFYQNEGKVYIKNVEFANNYSEDNGGAVYSNFGKFSKNEGMWLIGCSFTSNSADDLGGAIFNNGNHLYMEDCSVISNTAKRDGGGIYLDDDASISVGGVTVIRDNDGKGSLDNLVLEKGALISDFGLEPGSEIHLRSDTDGNVKLGGNLMSEFQMNQYFRADYGKLELTDTETVDTDLRASVFSEGKTVLIIGGVIIIAALTVGIIYKKRQKGGAAK